MILWWIVWSAARGGPADVNVTPGETEWVIEVRTPDAPPRVVRVAAPRTAEERLTVLALVESLSAAYELPLPPPPAPEKAPPTTVSPAASPPMSSPRSPPMSSAAASPAAPRTPPAGSAPAVPAAAVPAAAVPAAAVPAAAVPAAASPAPTVSAGAASAASSSVSPSSSAPPPVSPPAVSPPAVSPSSSAPPPAPTSAPAESPPAGRPSTPAVGSPPAASTPAASPPAASPPAASPPARPPIGSDPPVRHAAPPAATVDRRPRPAVLVWTGVDAVLRREGLLGAGLSLGIALEGRGGSAGLRTATRTPYALAIAPGTTVWEQLVAADVQARLRAAAVGAGLGVVRRRYVQGEFVAAPLLPVLSVGGGVGHRWSHVGLAALVWVDQDLARTRVLGTERDVTLSSRAVRVELRTSLGHRL